MKLFILLASILFLYILSPVFLLIYFLISLLTYIFLFATAEFEKRKIFSVLYILGLLFTWQYISTWHVGTFFRTSLSIGLGIFFLQQISYIISVVSGEFPLERKISSYFSATLFLGNIVAGPIEKISHLSGEINKKFHFKFYYSKFYVLLILNGFFKKCIADLLLPVSSQLFIQEIASRDFLTLMFPSIALMARFYADFSGYTDIAIGVSGILGIKVTENFKLPYLSVGLDEYWRRWHISFSNWIRQYLYVPLSYQFLSSDYPVPIALRIAVPICIVSVFAGLFHGISTVFLVWGLFNAVFISLSIHFLKPIRKNPNQLSIFLIWVGTMYIILISQILFFSKDLHQFWRIISSLHRVSSQFTFSFTEICVLMAMIVPHSLDYLLRKFKFTIVRNHFIYLVLFVFFVFFSVTFANPGAPFIYSQF